MWTAPLPRCPTHGQMNFRTPQTGWRDGTYGFWEEGTWVCNGWDGEGCDYQAPPLVWARVSDVTGLSFTIKRGVSSELGGEL